MPISEIERRRAVPSTKELYGYPESDWKVFRELREVALERFCKSVLDRTEAFRQDIRLSHHERYLALFRWLGERNQELALAFDNPGRSRMLSQLVAMRALDLLEREELMRFTRETRERVETLAKERSF
jgi:hypothetical protein